TLDRNLVRLDGLERVVGQPLADEILRLLARQPFEPDDAAFGAERLRHRGIEDADAGMPDVGTCTVSLDERDDGIVRNGDLSRPPSDRCAFGRRLEMRELWHVASLSSVILLSRVLGRFTRALTGIHTGACGKACGKTSARARESHACRARQRFAPFWCVDRCPLTGLAAPRSKRQIILERSHSFAVDLLRQENQPR